VTGNARTEVPRDNGDYKRYYAQVAQRVTKDQANPVRPEEAFQVQYLLDLGLRSAKEGRRLDVTPLNAFN
jgi:predicted dehydrogenase